MVGYKARARVREDLLHSQRRRARATVRAAREYGLRLKKSSYVFYYIWRV